MILYKKDAVWILESIARTDEQFDLIQKIRKGEADVSDYVLKHPCPPSFMGFLTSEFVFLSKKEKDEWLG